jgi:ABC-type sugar transport system substrate-binding protein
MFRSRTLATAAVAVAAAVALAGCQAPATGGGDGDGQAGAGQKLALIGLYAAPYTANIAAGAQAAADLDGAEFVQLGPTGLDPNKAIADFQNTVAGGTVGVLAMAFPSELWTTPIDKAADLGVSIVTSDVAAPGSKAVTHVGPGKVAMGAALADAYIAELDEDAEGIIVPGICVAGLRNLEAPLEGFADRLEAERPGIDVIEPEVTAGDIPGNFAAWQRIQAKYPDAVGFVGACDQDLLNLLKMKEAAGGDFLIGTTAGGDDPEAASAIAGGQMVGAVTQRSWLQGYVGMRVIADHAFRDTAMPEGWIDTGFDIVNKDNVDEIVEVLKDPALAEELYKALGDKLVADAAGADLHAVDYPNDAASIDEPNPQP